MKKVVYVEGVTELVFVYNLICTHYYYNGAQVQVHNINLDPVAGLQIPADFGTQDAPDYYQLVCVGGDSGVVSYMKERYKGHVDAGFDVIVGLKDVYGSAYTRLAGHEYKTAEINRLVAGQKEQLAEHERAHLCFAIMEVEAWILGMNDSLVRSYPEIKLQADSDPETAYVHPYKVLHDALGAVGVQFEKHWGDILAVLNRFSKENFEQLYHSAHCSSFKVFYDVLFGRTVCLDNISQQK